MEHLTGKLIREKVVQQYYFEKFLCGKAKKMLPKSGEFDRYTISDNVKMLHPEQDIVTKAEADAEGFEGAYKPDFILYPSKKSLEELNEVVNIEIKWKGEGVNEVGIDAMTDSIIIRIDKRYFRPTEVETLLGDSTKAKNKLNWQPKISFQELVKEMMMVDLQEAKKDKLCEEEGFNVFNYHE